MNKKKRRGVLTYQKHMSNKYQQGVHNVSRAKPSPPKVSKKCLGSRRGSECTKTILIYIVGSYFETQSIMSSILVAIEI